MTTYIKFPRNPVPQKHKIIRITEDYVVRQLGYSQAFWNFIHSEYKNDEAMPGKGESVKSWLAQEHEFWSSPDSDDDE